MIAAVDAHYDEERSTAAGAAVVISTWEAERAVAEYVARQAPIEPYVPGAFYKREMPILLAVMERVLQPLDAVVVDGYVQLGEKPGLGMRLWEALGRTTPVVGVAKTQFHGANSVEIIRGKSKVPLFVTAIGIDPCEAADKVAIMAGPFRIPKILQQVDQLARRQLQVPKDH